MTEALTGERIMDCARAREALDEAVFGLAEEEVRRHLEGCAACREALEARRAAWERVRRAGDVSVRVPEFSPRRLPVRFGGLLRRWALAAAAAAAAALLLTLFPWRVATPPTGEVEPFGYSELRYPVRVAGEAEFVLDLPTDVDRRTAYVILEVWPLFAAGEGALSVETDDGVRRHSKVLGGAGPFRFILRRDLTATGRIRFRADPDRPVEVRVIVCWRTTMP